MKVLRQLSPMPCVHSAFPFLAWHSLRTRRSIRQKGVELIPEFYADLEYDGDGNLILSRVHDAVDPVTGGGQGACG